MSSSSSSSSNLNHKHNESLSVLDLQEAKGDSVSTNNHHDDDESDCLKTGIGYYSMTSFDEQMRLAKKREELRRKKEMEAKLGGSRVSIKDRLKMFEKNSASASS